MHACPPGRRRRPPSATSHLRGLAELLLDATERKDIDAPTLIRVVADRVDAPPDAVELGLLPLLDDPAVALLGFMAPADWTALGVSAVGQARHLDAADARSEARFVHLVGRSGTWASAARLASELPVVVESGRSPPGGRIDDVCRRAFGLPTPPPSESTDALFATVWLDLIAATAASEPPRRRPRRWLDVAAMHPAVRVLSAGRGGQRAATPDALEALAAELARTTTWSGLRRAWAQGTHTIGAIDPALASWMDDGMLSRWVFEEFADVTDLLDVVHSLLPPRIARDVARVAGRAISEGGRP